MPLDIPAVRDRLRSFDFVSLFTQELGWDFPANRRTPLSVTVKQKSFDLQTIAQKRNVPIYLYQSAAGEDFPDSVTRRAIHKEARKSAHEHLIIYVDAQRTTQIWQWVAYRTGQPAAYREQTYVPASQSGDALIQKLATISVPISEEEAIDLTGAVQKLRDAFDREKVTKRFYDRFKVEHAAFLKFIKGIKAEGDLQWYTSLMLNRLMFVYFIQWKGFLDGNVNYLRNRMQRVREARGKDKFQSFYRYFLVRLFHDGLGKHETERKLDREMEKLLGKVPYLNGGFFEVHQLEERNANIDIPDEAFERLFNFFDEFSWNLDDRPLQAGNEINPDVVGYIFEKYINQKLMGAYYTKEDITEYSSKNTIIPFLFDSAKKKCPSAFKPESSLWKILSDNPDRYIYAAVRHGVIDDQGNVIPLPKDIAAGIKNVEKRENWNRPAADPFALPTETWREHVVRRTRCLELREKLQRGEVHEINDLITLNLDIWQFARDTIVNCEGPELLRAFWHAIQFVTVLDPTCGSGAFLFAALRILETLYSDCLERMERFIENADSPVPGAAFSEAVAETPASASGKRKNGKAPQIFSDFRKVLENITEHRGQKYFILKSIIINNLFGVDIMEEAVEICKLRLFLKLVAQVERVDQIEPLPDIDFNVRAGNTLVGYVSLAEIKKSQAGTLGFGASEIKHIEEDALAVEKCFEQFRAQQTTHGGKVTAKDKAELRMRLAKLDRELDQYLAGECRVDAKNSKAFDAWKCAHHPFHWFVEFYGIMSHGGFDIIIGNPPYAEIPKELERSVLKRTFKTALERWSRDEDLYTLVLERSFAILATAGRFGMILPLSMAFSTKRPFQVLRGLVAALPGEWWWSHFDRIPSALFGNDVRTRCTIAVYGPSETASPKRCTTALIRWTAECRSSLFATLHYAAFSSSLDIGEGIPKVGSQIQADSLAALVKTKAKLGADLTSSVAFSALAAAAPKFPQPCVFVGGTAYNWFPVWREIPETTDMRGKPSLPARTAGFKFKDEESANVVFALLTSALGYWWWACASDGFNLKKWLLDRFPISLSTISASGQKELAQLGAEMKRELKRHYVFKDNKGRIGNFFLPACAATTRRIDSAIARHVPYLSEEFFEDVRAFNQSFSRADVGDADESDGDE